MFICLPNDISCMDDSTISHQFIDPDNACNQPPPSEILFHSSQQYDLCQSICVCVCVCACVCVYIHAYLQPLTRIINISYVQMWKEHHKSEINLKSKIPNKYTIYRVDHQLQRSYNQDRSKCHYHATLGQALNITWLRYHNLLSIAASYSCKITGVLGICGTCTHTLTVTVPCTLQSKCQYHRKVPNQR